MYGDILWGAKPLETREWWQSPLIPGLKATLGYTRLNLSRKRNGAHTNVLPALGSHRPLVQARGMEAGMIWLGGQRFIRQEETRAMQSALWWK